ncbi:hypothetical protein FS749_000157, partial [Ceratobasidium sp. UAMH 11750]
MQLHTSNRNLPSSLLSSSSPAPLYIMSYQAAALTIAGAFAVACAFIGYKRRVSSRLALPPSPRGSYPFLGHALVLPTDEEYLTYTEWSKELKSDIISLQALGQNIVILSSLQSA